MEEWTTIRYLHAQGVPTKAIARQLRISRNTVRRALRREGPPRYVRAGKPNPQLEPLRDEIAAMLYGREPFIGSRILEELRVRGYTGSKTALYEFIRHLKEDEVAARKVRLRFETGPGEQGQFDWSTYRVSIGGSMVDAVIFRNILAFSRLQALGASRDQTWMSVYEALEDSFTFFGGVPRGEVVDNARCFTTTAFPNGTWNARWLEFCGHYGFRPIPCRAYHPESKGKVENPFRYLEEHFIKGHQWDDWESFCRELRGFQDHVNQRVHGTTRERPVDRFVRERALLTPLPCRRFVATDEIWRSVSWDCLIPWNGSRYEVPLVHAGRRVRVRTSQGTWLHVFDDADRRIAVHALSSVKGKTMLLPAGNRPPQRAPHTRVLLEARFRESFPDEEIFLQGLYEAHRKAPSSALRAVLELSTVYPPAAMSWAFSLAVAHHTFAPRFLAGLLSRVPPEVLPPSLPGSESKADLPRLSVHRDLSDYQRVLQRAGGWR